MIRSEKKQILLVDDCSSLTRLATHIIKEMPADYEIHTASNAEEAVETLIEERISLVVTDYQMPGTNGLELIPHIHRITSETPILVMSAFEDGGLERKVLTQGAVGFVRKSRLAQELPERIERTFHSCTDRNSNINQASRDCIHEQTSKLIIPNDRSAIPDIVAYCQELLDIFEICEKQEQIRTGISIEEAIVNGMIHGNLEVGSELRGVDDMAYFQLIDQRLSEEPYGNRQVEIDIELNSNLAKFVIRDQGPGYDVSALPDPTDDKNLLKASGRGILLIRSFMDEVKHNQSGNEITLVKYKTISQEQTTTRLTEQDCSGPGESNLRAVHSSY